MAQQEKELKYELSEAAYHALLGLLGQGKLLNFSNLYFKAAEQTGRRDWVLRLRQAEGVPGELTLKVGKEVSPGTFSSVEYVALVDSSSPCDWEDTEPLRVFRDQISRAALVRQGEATNQRRVVEAPLGPVPLWEIDRTTLPNGAVFHELEIEYPPETSPSSAQIAGFRAQLEEWMFEQGLKAEPSRKTKYRRFLDSLGGASGL